MKNKISFAALLLLLTNGLFAQDKFYTKKGNITFYSKAPMENIEALNKSVICVLDSKTGAIQFAVMIKGFEFEKALMQEHFNENYLESHKYPKAEFKGQVTNYASIDFSKEGTYPVTVKGKLAIHGETRDVETRGTIVVKSDKIAATADFEIELADYKVEIPKLVKDNISKTVKIVVDCTLDVLKP